MVKIREALNLERENTHGKRRELSDEKLKTRLEVNDMAPIFITREMKKKKINGITT